MHGVPLYKVSENIKPALVILEGVVPKILRYREPLALENDTYGVGHNDRRILSSVKIKSFIQLKGALLIHRHREPPKLRLLASGNPERGPPSPLEKAL